MFVDSKLNSTGFRRVFNSDLRTKVGLFEPVRVGRVKHGGEQWVDKHDREDKTAEESK